jgi:Rieske Fe-S protein
MSPISRPEDAALSRRTILSAVVPICVAATLGACGSDPSVEPPADAPSAAPPAGIPSDSPGTPEDAPSPQRLTSTRSVPVGGGKVVDGVLVVQPLPGLFKAYDARCPHLAAMVSPPKDGVITCRQHNSQFLDIDGSRLGGPAPRGLKEIVIEVDGTDILKM